MENTESSNITTLQYLGARPQEHREQHSLPGRAEDVPVHKLPPELLLGVLAAVDLVVARDVLVEGAEEDHGHHARQEEHDDEAVEDGEPLDVGVGHAVQYVVPSARPLHIIVLPKIGFNVNP